MINVKLLFQLINQLLTNKLVNMDTNEILIWSSLRLWPHCLGYSNFRHSSQIQVMDWIKFQNRSLYFNLNQTFMLRTADLMFKRNELTHLRSPNHTKNGERESERNETKDKDEKRRTKLQQLHRRTNNREIRSAPETWLQIIEIWKRNWGKIIGKFALADLCAMGFVGFHEALNRLCVDGSGQPNW